MTKIIDLRSDTVTKPSMDMLKAMYNAEVGDALFGEDPTVNLLEETAAQMFGIEKALYCPSGTMTNQIAIKVHTEPGCEVICNENAHIYYHEGGGMMFNSGVSVSLLPGDRGRIKAEDVEARINPDDIHRPVSRLVEVENTCNMGGGSFYDFKSIEEIHHICRKHNLKFHLDGARLFNALAETNETPADYGKLFDSISICLSKGLGAPVGSLLLGDAAFIKKATRIRKLFGGAMRQAGYIAAAGLYALQNNTLRLKEDHKKAKYIGNILKNISFVKEVLPVDTNIIIFTVKDNDSKKLVDKLRQNNIWALPISKNAVRFVTHLNITDDMMEDFGRRIKQL